MHHVSLHVSPRNMSAAGLALPSRAAARDPDAASPMPRAQFLAQAIAIARTRLALRAIDLAEVECALRLGLDAETAARWLSDIDELDGIVMAADAARQTAEAAT